MDRSEAIRVIEELLVDRDNDSRYPCVSSPRHYEALDLAIEALGQTEIVRCKDCKHYNPPHIKYNDGTRKDYPDGLVAVDIGMNVGGKCENSTTTMRTYCTAHDRENPDDFEELVIFRQPMEYCSFGEKAEKHQLSGETSTIFEKESVEGDAESATTTDCISRQQTIEAIEEVDWYHVNSKGELVHGSTSDEESWYKADDIYKAIESLPPVTPTERTGEWIVYPLIGEGRVELECSECGNTVIGAISYKPKFCENCGAIMESEKLAMQRR